jgi:hypothetical protein
MTTSQTTQPLLARAWADGYLPSPERFDEIVTKACEHRPWFNDYVWDNELLKRTIVIKYLADTYTNGRVWEVWRNEEICGILLVERVNMGVDAYFHAIFFDRQLAGKFQPSCTSSRSGCSARLASDPKLLTARGALSSGARTCGRGSGTTPCCFPSRRTSSRPWKRNLWLVLSSLLASVQPLAPLAVSSAAAKLSAHPPLFQGSLIPHSNSC